MALCVRPHPLSPSVDRVAPGKARLPAQSARQPVREEPQHGALGRYAVPGHGNYLCVTTATWPGVLLCDPAGPLPGASRTGRASSLPRSRYPIPQLLPLSVAQPAGHVGVPSCEGGGRHRGQIALQPWGPEQAGGGERESRARPDKPSLPCARTHHAFSTLRTLFIFTWEYLSHVTARGVSQFHRCVFFFLGET